ncbi:MAG TPA: LacI family DNA-binding transcriptional regulator [Chthonomonadales bacterium]|nr:LacI family DNA-binding transcriptional regulator [Chthonomonadales bacterium]
MATIRDVARLAGTSVSAVSAALNHNNRHNIRVGHTTRARIHAAAAELGYSANPIARSLATGRTGVLGLVFPYSGAFTDRNPFCIEVMSGVFDEVVRRKVHVMLYTGASDTWNAGDESSAIDPRVDGLLLVLPSPDSPAVDRALREGVPCVAVVYEPSSPDLICVNADDEKGGLLATRHLISLGHRRIAHLAGQPQVATSAPRTRGYFNALLEAGIPRDDDLVLTAGFTEGDGIRGMKRLLELPATKRPTAVFACNDLCARGALNASQAAGLSVPDDMAIVGFDDTWFAPLLQPSLTTVRMPTYEMAVLATRMLIDLVNGKEPEEKQPVLPVSLSIRESTVR